MSRSQSALSTTAVTTALALTVVFGLALFPWSNTALAGEAKEHGAKIHDVEGEVTNPVRISGEVPAYPEEERKNRITGPVIAKCVINKAGEVESVEILKSPSAAFEQPVRDALATWRFEPATLDGEPVEVYYNISINFRRDAEEKSEV